MKILIVDDDKDIVELLSIYVENEGYEVEKAYNGKEALSKLNMNPDIALMILDVMMPQMDGMEVIREVRKESQIPVLILSAKTDDLDKIQGLVQGAQPEPPAAFFNPHGAHVPTHIVNPQGVKQARRQVFHQAHPRFLAEDGAEQIRI